MVREDDGERSGTRAFIRPIEGKRETLKHQLTKKFGTIPDKTMARIEALDSLEELDRYLDRVLTAESLEAMGLQRPVNWRAPSPASLNRAPRLLDADQEFPPQKESPREQNLPLFKIINKLEVVPMWRRNELIEENGSKTTCLLIKRRKTNPWSPFESGRTSPYSRPQEIISTSQSISSGYWSRLSQLLPLSHTEEVHTVTAFRPTVR